jgi:hypothetical protein
MTEFYVSAGNTGAVGVENRRARKLPNSWTTVTATGMANGESTIKKMKIGNNIASLTFSAERIRRICRR